MDFEVAQVELELNPQDKALQAKWQDSKQLLFEFTEAKMKWMAEVLRTKSILYGDKPGYIAASFKAQAHRTKLRGLKDANDQLQVEWGGMEKVALDHFSRLFSSQNEASEEEIERVLQQVKIKLSEDKMQQMEASVTNEELKQVVSQLGNNKAPGLDGVSVEFWILFWDSLVPLLTQVINAGISKKRFGKKFLKGLIALLHKKGDVAMMKNKRGISLLNTSYKIGTKAFQKRLTKVLVKLISTQ